MVTVSGNPNPYPTNLAKQSACIALYYRDAWNVVERTAYI